MFRKRPEHFAEEEAARGILCRRAIVTYSEREGCGVLLAASVDGVLRAERVGLGSRGVLRAASVGIALSPSSSVVVLLKSDFLAYYC